MNDKWMGSSFIVENFRLFTAKRLKRSACRGPNIDLSYMFIKYRRKFSMLFSILSFCMRHNNINTLELFYKRKAEYAVHKILIL